MGHADSEIPRLEAAVLREIEAAQRLGEALNEARSALERLDLTAFRGAIARAQSLSDALRQRGTDCAAATRRLAAGCGLGQGSSLSDVLRRFGTEQGLAGSAKELRRCLKVLGSEVSALGLATRYGNRVCAHLVGLQRGAFGAGYDVRGRLVQATMTNGRRA
ncbi:MAG: hypothetical protein HY900_30525 [Deltaproteobacteria bacterium]|nr:hypothetical protein [Deltaproteobacteria bacterium]